jgi:hypothetical protein
MIEIFFGIFGYSNTLIIDLVHLDHLDLNLFCGVCLVPTQRYPKVYLLVWENPDLEFFFKIEILFRPAAFLRSVYRGKSVGL